MCVCAHAPLALFGLQAVFQTPFTSVIDWPDLHSNYVKCGAAMPLMLNLASQETNANTICRIQVSYRVAKPCLLPLYFLYHFNDTSLKLSAKFTGGSF